MVPDVAVAIEVRGGEGPVEAAAASCSEVLGNGRCRAVSESGAIGGAGWYALVVFDEATMLTARIELRRTPAGAGVTSRAVHFDSGDSLEQRYRAIGLIAAAQVLGVAPELAPGASEPEPRPALEPQSPIESRTREPVQATAAVGVDLAAWTGPALDRGPPRVGLSVRPWLALFQPVLLEAGVAAAIRPDDPQVIWGTASASVVLVLTPSRAPVEARARLGVAVGRVRASTRNGETGERESSGAYQIGPELGVNLAWPARSPVSLLAGAELAAPRPRARVEVRGRDAGRQPSLLWAAALGLRLRF